jgi:uncharacterized membrane protein
MWETLLNAASSCSRSTRKGQAGQSTVFVAFALVALLCFLALAIDVGYLRYQRRQIQTAADAAALAGASELSYTGVSAAAKADSSSNGYTDGSRRRLLTYKRARR